MRILVHGNELAVHVAKQARPVGEAYDPAAGFTEEVEYIGYDDLRKLIRAARDAQLSARDIAALAAITAGPAGLEQPSTSGEREIGP